MLAGIGRRVLEVGAQVREWRFETFHPHQMIGIGDRRF
jgi:hypothetical protein